MNSNRQAMLLLSLSLLLVSSVARVRDLRVSCVRVYFVGSFASRQFHRPLTVSEKFITGELFGLVNQRTSHSYSFNIGHLLCSSSAKLISMPSCEKLSLQK